MPSLARERGPVRWQGGSAETTLRQGPCRSRGDRPLQRASSARAGVAHDRGHEPRSRAWPGRPVRKPPARRASWHPWLLPPSGGLLMLVRAAKGIEGVIRRELPRHVLEVVLARRLEPRGQGIESGRLGRKVAVSSIRTSHNQGQRAECRSVELVLLEERIE